MGEEMLHHLGYLRSEFSGLGSTPIGVPLEEGGLLRRIIVPIGPTPTVMDTQMGLDQLVVQVEFDGGIGDASIEGLVDVAMRDRVGSLQHLSMTVVSHLALHPSYQFEGQGW